MALTTRPTQLQIGIDISDHIMRAVLIHSHGRRRKIQSYAEVALEPGIITRGVINEPLEATAALKQLVRSRMRIKRAPAVIGLPETHSFIKTAHADSAHEQHEIEKHLPFAYEDVTIDTVRYPDTGKNGPRTRFGFAAVKTEVAAAYEQMAIHAGLHVRALEIESQAMARLYTTDIARPVTIILCDIGRNNTTFVVVNQRHIDFTHTSTRIAGQAVTAEIMETLQVDEETAESLKYQEQNTAPTAEQASIATIMNAHTDALTSEIHRVVEFHSTHSPHGAEHEYEVHLTGSGSLLSSVRHHIEEKVQHPVYQATPITHLGIPKKMGNSVLSYNAAIGHALRPFTY